MRCGQKCNRGVWTIPWPVPGAGCTWSGRGGVPGRSPRLHSWEIIMFETTELRRSLDKATYEHLLPELRSNLLRVQNELYASKKFPVLVIIGGVDGAGKGE